jgi:hypothetical protein
MGTEQEKGEIEVSVFREFIAQSRLPIVPTSVKKCIGQAVPDIQCEFIGGELVAFELVEVCSSELAEKIAYARAGGVFPTMAVNSPVQKIIGNKISKRYQTELPIELLCYTNGRIIDPDDAILEYLRSALKKEAICPFRRVWLLGEKSDVYKVWEVSTVGQPT